MQGGQLGDKDQQASSGGTAFNSDQNNFSSQIPKKSRVGLFGWLLSLLLLICVCFMLYKVYTKIQTEQDKLVSETKGLRNNNVDLEKQLEDLTLFLQKDPCLVPEEYNGFSLINPLQKQPQAQTQLQAQTQPQYQPEAQVLPQSQTQPEPQSQTQPQVQPQVQVQPRPQTQSQPQGELQSQNEPDSSIQFESTEKEPKKDEVPAKEPKKDEAPDKPMISNPTEVEDAIVFIATDESTGTGFFVAPGVIATNKHVAGEESLGRIVYVVSKGLGGIAEGKVLALSQAGKQDYAIIQLEDSSISSPKPLDLCGTVKKTEKIGTWGFPAVISEEDPKLQALFAGDATSVPEVVYSDGVVNVIYEEAPSLILHTAILSHGNSGGPLVNISGCVVGINTLIHMDDKSYRQTNISLGASDLYDFLSSNGINAKYHP